MNAIEQALAECFGRPPDVSEGIAWIFEDNPISKPLGLFTVAFAKQLCADDPLYIWRKA